jgi:precorrin-6Y C5,15-methyltransferase (decarboxylating)
MSAPVWVIGVGAEGPAGLPPAATRLIAGADQLWGGARLLADWPDHPAQKILLGSGLAAQIEALRGRGERNVVVLASGDPGFFGIAGTILRVLGAQETRIVPHVTSLQLAFARAGVPWSDAIFTSAHARPLAEVVGWARRAPKLGILTDPSHHPAAIAAALLAAGVADCRAIVAENLGLPEERLVDTRLSQLTGQAFAPLTVLLLVQDPDWRPRPVFAPRPDAAYAHRRGLITKSDVRALSLARLALSETDQVWDIGAGSGALSIEIAELAWRGRVWAVEHDPENLGYLRENVARYGAANVEIVPGRAPAALGGLPPPAAVFIGGTDGEMAGILRHICDVAQPACRIVMNMVTLEHLQQARALCGELGLASELTQVSIAQGQPIAGLTRLAPLNPVFILAAGAPCASAQDAPGACLQEPAHD